MRRHRASSDAAVRCLVFLKHDWVSGKAGRRQGKQTPRSMAARQHDALAGSERLTFSCTRQHQALDGLCCPTDASDSGRPTGCRCAAQAVPDCC